MISKVFNTITTYNLISKGDNVLCAVSGGADSVVLLHILSQLKDSMGFSLKAAHFNHQIRGEQADSDELFVKMLCDILDIELILGSANVPEYAKQNGYTLEQAGRILRYKFFEEQRPDKIAVAHHMDDQAESVLMHLIRGSGTLGMCGMQPKRDKIIRPLLNVRRSEIEEYAKNNSLDYCTDSTNLVADTTRNILRLEIIPQITEKLNPGFVKSICKMAELVSNDEQYLTNIANEQLLNCTISPNCYSRTRFSELEEPILSRTLRLATVKAGAFADIEQKHIELIKGLLNGRTGSSLNLPHINISTSYDKIYFYSKDNCATIGSDKDYCFELSNDCTYSTEDYIITCSILDYDCSNAHIDTMKQMSRVSYLDLDSLPDGCVIRSRNTGDRIHPVGAKGSKKLKDFFIDKKIERRSRNLPLICNGSTVLCAVGLCVAEEAKVKAETKQILKIEYTEVNQ